MSRGRRMRPSPAVQTPAVAMKSAFPALGSAALTRTRDLNGTVVESLGPTSKAFRNGALGDRVDGRSREGKFLRRVEAELVAQIGGEPSFAQELLIRRVARSSLQLELLDEKMMRGEFRESDGRIQGGLQNAVRLCLRELGTQLCREAAIVQALYLERRQHCRIQIIEGPDGELIDRETFEREHLKRSRW
jgi:hypothetical protein